MLSVSLAFFVFDIFRWRAALLYAKIYHNLCSTLDWSSKLPCETKLVSPEGENLFSAHAGRKL